mmetsp:Transcript_19288/g.37259  ORF Transcript_19288/g.37259 Transcript_19288/m.37259 type:complete len:709 (+) Transcript_19288:79-2205(+)
MPKMRSLVKAFLWVTLVSGSELERQAGDEEKRRSDNAPKIPERLQRLYDMEGPELDSEETDAFAKARSAKIFHGHNPHNHNPHSHFPTPSPLTKNPSVAPTTRNPTSTPNSVSPSQAPVTRQPFSGHPLTASPNTRSPESAAPTCHPTSTTPTSAPRTSAPTTRSPTRTGAELTTFTAVYPWLSMDNQLDRQWKVNQFVANYKGAIATYAHIHNDRVDVGLSAGSIVTRTRVAFDYSSSADGFSRSGGNLGDSPMENAEKLAAKLRTNPGAIFNTANDYNVQFYGIPQIHSIHIRTPSPQISTMEPTTKAPATTSPQTMGPTVSPATSSPQTLAPSAAPTTCSPSEAPSAVPTASPSTLEESLRLFRVFGKLRFDGLTCGASKDITTNVEEAFKRYFEDVLDEGEVEATADACTEASSAQRVSFVFYKLTFQEGTYVYGEINTNVSRIFEGEGEWTGGTVVLDGGIVSDRGNGPDDPSSSTASVSPGVVALIVIFVVASIAVVVGGACCWFKRRRTGKMKLDTQSNFPGGSLEMARDKSEQSSVYSVDSKAPLADNLPDLKDEADAVREESVDTYNEHMTPVVTKRRRRKKGLSGPGIVSRPESQVSSGMPTVVDVSGKPVGSEITSGSMRERSYSVDPADSSNPPSRFMLNSKETSSVAAGSEPTSLALKVSGISGSNTGGGVVIENIRATGEGEESREESKTHGKV